MQYFNEVEQAKLNVSVGSPTPASVHSLMSRSLQLCKKPSELNNKLKDNIMYCSVVMTHDCLYLCNEEHRWRLKLDFDHTYERLAVKRVQDVDEILLSKQNPSFVKIIFSSCADSRRASLKIGLSICKGGDRMNDIDASCAAAGRVEADFWVLIIPCEHERLRFLACLKNSWKSLFKVDLTVICA